MAIVLKQSGTTGTSAAAPSNISVNFSATVLGSALVVFVSATGAANVAITSLPAPWITIFNSSANSLARALFVQPNNPGGVTTVTVSLANTTAGGAAMIFGEFTGVAVSSPLDASVTTTSAGSTGQSTQFATIPPNSDELVLGDLACVVTTLNNITGSSPGFVLVGNVSSKVATTNAQEILYWKINAINLRTIWTTSLAASVANVQDISRYFAADSGAYVLNNIGGNAGILSPSGGVTPIVGGSPTQINSGYGGEVPSPPGSGVFFSGMIGG